MATEQNELSDRVVEHRRFDLRLHRATARAFFGGKVPQRCPADAHFAPVEGEETGHGAQQGAFSAAVRPGHGEHFAAADFEVDTPEHFATGVAGADGPRLEKWLLLRFHSFSTSSRNFCPAWSAAGPGMLNARAGKTTTRSSRTARKCLRTGCPRSRARTASLFAPP